MSFTGTEDQSISLTTAAEWTKNYRDSAGTGAILGAYYSGSAISGILAQTGCVGIRAYYAIDDNGVKQLIYTGVDSSGNDLYTGALADRGAICPPNCSTSNPLNTTTV